MNRPSKMLVDSATTPPCEKLISICIPTYNRARWLAAALESLLPQMGSDTELLVYDTGSTDGTDELMADYVHRFPAIRFFSLDTKRGFDETLLLLLEQCRGEYVWFFGSDDVLGEGAVDSIRRRILQTEPRPSLVYLNHDVVDDAGKLLISQNVGRSVDREFRDGRQCIAWLGLYLGYISSCIFRRDDFFPVASAAEFIGSLWMGLHLNLWSLSKGGPALYVAEPMVRAHRNPENVYDYGEIFCRRASQVFWHARKLGIGRLTIYRAMNRTVRSFYLPFCVFQRCDNSAEFNRAFPAMLRASWAYPWFWLLIAPLRFVPSQLVRVIRNYLRGHRDRRNDKHRPRRSVHRVEEMPRTPKDASAFRVPFRALLRARKLSVAFGADRLFKAIPFLVSRYRALYSRLRPEGTVRTRFRGHTLYLDLRDMEITRTILTVGAYERCETDIFVRSLADGMVVVDAGANVGTYTLEAARRVGEAGKVFAFEPEPRNFDLLCRNLEANGCRNVTPVRKALLNRRGVGTLSISHDSSGGHFIEISRASGECVEVETTTLDDYFRGKSSRLDVIKMDTQGAEASIFQGMPGLLSANPDLTLFTEFWPVGIQTSGYDPQKFLEALSLAGFSVGMFNQESGRVEALEADQQQEFVQSLLREDAGRYFADLLCLRGNAIRGPVGRHTWGAARPWRERRTWRSAEPRGLMLKENR